MGKYRESGNVIIGGQEFHTDAPIVNFREGPRWDATIESCIVTETDPNPFSRCTMQAPGKYAPYQGFGGHKFTRRYQGRPALWHSWNRGVNAPYDAAKQVIRQFMIHHDGCASADMCFSVLQNERGLSCHFLVDNDGTIFQTLDLALEGWHGSELNGSSIGVELCNRGDAAKEPTYYSRRGQSREPKPCKINGHVIKSFDFTEAQRQAMTKLGQALLRLLPNLPAEYPQSSPGQPALDTIGYAGLARFSGYVGHYHLTTNKWDPGPWDFKLFCEGIRGAFSWPAWPRGAPGKGQSKPEIPKEASLVKEEAELLYKLNEARADGGYFPVGPWGEARLWHGGVHLAADERSKVFAPFPGRLVAARMGASSPIGSTNFVLLRHQMTLTDRKLEFYSLYMHLGDELKATEPVPWLAKARTGKDGKPRELRSGEVWLLDEAIEAGAHIGHVGIAGPGDLAKAQIHVELFANSDLFEGMSGIPWETIDGTTGGRFCDAVRINEVIDNNKDMILSREELKSFYTSGAGAATYYLVTRHISEWTADPDWSESLRLPKDFRHLKPAAIDALVADQITPGLWWDDKTAAHCKLPPDGVVYHYHPISFVSWLNQKLIDAQPAAKIDVSDAGAVPDGITDDRDGVGMVSQDAFVVNTCNEQLTLKELVQGFDAPECKP